jgi:ATP/maltotriose-dependent transcriptional regulator MalT
MAVSAPASFTPAAFARFGDLLRFLRRRAQLTQRELSIAVGYNFAQICRLEQGQRLPDPAIVAAVFVPALDLAHEPEWAARLVELAEAARLERRDAELANLASSASTPELAPPEVGALEPPEAIPAPTPHEVPRPRLVARLHARLVAERCVMLCGLPGMGKTTLAAALAREYAETTPVFWLTFTAGVTTSIETVIRQLAQFLLLHGQRDAQTLLRQPLREGTVQPLDRRLGLISSALGRLGAATNGRRATPLLLCFDNLHLVQDDADIVHALRHLAATSTARLLLIGRENTQALPGCPQVRLDGLEPEEGRQLIAYLARQHESGSAAPAWAASLLEQTSGSPMLLQLAVGQLLDEDAVPEAFIARLASQPQIAAYLLETVRRHTSPAAWGLLSLIAVFRQPIDLYDPALIELITQADGVADLGAALDELIRRHLIHHPTRAWPHRLVRDYVYTALSTLPLHRRQLHRIAAEWSEHGLNDPVEASYHYYMAGDLAAAAAALTDHVEAINQHGRALAAADMAELLCAQARRPAKGDAMTEIQRTLHTLRGDLLIHTLRAGEAEASYRAALALTTGATEQATIVVRLMQSLAQRGQAAEALDLSRRASASIGPAENGLLAQLAAGESYAHLMRADYAAADEAARHALALAEQAELPNAREAAEARVRAHRVRGTLMRYRHDIAAAQAHFQQAARAARQIGSPELVLRCRMDEVRLLLAYGSPATMLERCEDMLADPHTSGDSYAVAKIQGIMALSHLLCDQPAAGLAAAEREYDLSAEIGDTDGLLMATNHCAFLLITLDRVAEARVLIEQALAHYESTGETYELGLTLDKLGMIQLLEGDAAGALETLRRGLWHATATGDTKIRIDLLNDMAIGLLMTGELEDAQQLVAMSADEGGPWVELERQLIAGMIALAGGDAQAARAAADTLRARARQAGYLRYQRKADQLAAAITSPPKLGGWPRLMWVTEP